MVGIIGYNLCDVLAQRMKCGKMRWSINGTNNLSKMLSEKFSNRLFDTIYKIYKNINPNEVLDTIIIKLPLSVFQENNSSFLQILLD